MSTPSRVGEAHNMNGVRGKLEKELIYLSGEASELFLSVHSVLTCISLWSIDFYFIILYSILYF